MPWKTQSSNNVMLFNGIPVADCEDFPSTSNRSLRKRKNEFIPHRFVYFKKHIFFAITKLSSLLILYTVHQNNTLVKLKWQRS